MQDTVKCINLRFSNDLYECVFNIWQKDVPTYVAWEDKKEYPLPAKCEWILIACDPYDIDSQYQGKYVMLARAESDPRPEKRDPEGKKRGIHLTGHIFLPKPVNIEHSAGRDFWRELPKNEAQNIARQGGLDNLPSNFKFL